MRCAVVPTSRHRSKRQPPRRGPDGAPVRPERHGIGFSCSLQRVQNALAPKHGTTSKTNTQPEITCDAIASSNRRAPSNLYNRNNAPRQPCPLELMLLTAAHLQEILPHCKSKQAHRCFRRLLPIAPDTCNPRLIHLFARIIISVTPCRRVLSAELTPNNDLLLVSANKAQIHTDESRLESQHVRGVCGSRLKHIEKRSCNTSTHDNTISRCQKCLRISRGTEHLKNSRKIDNRHHLMHKGKKHSGQPRALAVV